MTPPKAERGGFVGFGTTIDTTERAGVENDTPLRPKSKRGKTFRSGPGATRTRDLLLRSAGPTASHRHPALIHPAGKGMGAEWR